MNTVLSQVLGPAKTATLQLQEKNLTPGDFFRLWYQCKSKLDKVDSAFASSLSQAIRKREKELFENKAFLCSMYLDPRFNVMLSPEEREIAIINLTNLHRKLYSPKLNYNEEGERTAITQESSICTTGNDCDDLENMLVRAEKDKAIESRPQSSNISSTIREFITSNKRIDKDSDLILWWKSARLQNPELYKFAEIVHATPVTQVSVERLFSTLKVILSPQRNSLAPQSLENILIVNANFKS